jgi:pyruvate kinase
LSPLTRKDREDLAFGLALGVDWVALSFVQCADDVLALRELVGQRAGVLSKIEKPQALAELDAIIEASDAVMVARGDLGVELAAEDVPSWQRKIVEASRARGKPVVVATQMLESMIDSPTPTRAEASDVAHAVYLGADAVMLSAESASGQYPLEAVSTMARIVQRAEQDRAYTDARERPAAPDRAALIAAALRAAHAVVPLACAVVYTSTGASAFRVAQERAQLALIGLTPSAEVARRLTLAWGVNPAVAAAPEDAQAMIAEAVSAARRMGLASEDLPLAVVAGLPFATAGSTNLLRIVWPELADAPAPKQSMMKSPKAAHALLE